MTIFTREGKKIKNLSKTRGSHPGKGIKIIHLEKLEAIANRG